MNGQHNKKEGILFRHLLCFLSTFLAFPIPFHHGISFFPPRGKFLSIVVERNLPRGGKILLVRKTTTMTYRVRVLSTDARRLRKDA